MTTASGITITTSDRKLTSSFVVGDSPVAGGEQLEEAADDQADRRPGHSRPAGRPASSTSS